MKASRVISSLEGVGFSVICQLHDDGCFSISYQTRGEFACQEFRMRDAERFNELSDVFQNAFQEAWAVTDLAALSFHTLDCFIDAAIDRICDIYFLYDEIKW